MAGGGGGGRWSRPISVVGEGGVNRAIGYGRGGGGGCKVNDRQTTNSVDCVELRPNFDGSISRLGREEELPAEATLRPLATRLAVRLAIRLAIRLWPAKHDH
jgi:hypothetical protein